MRLAAALFAAATLASAPALAQTLDLSTIKCKDFLGSGKDNIAVIITWLDGYYKDKDDPPIIDFASFPISSPPNGNGNTFPGTYDALGRTLFVGVTADF